MILNVMMMVVLTTPDPALLIARSCVGEAGFGSAETGECVAIAHVYRKRAEMYGRDISWIARRYSAAIKSGGRLWVRSLNRDGRRPRGWPQHLDWDDYRGQWWTVVDQVDAWFRGEHPDPLPTAEHYGGPMDVGLNMGVWRRLWTPLYRNRFYERRQK